MSADVAQCSATAPGIYCARSLDLPASGLDKPSCRWRLITTVMANPDVAVFKKRHLQGILAKSGRLLGLRFGAATDLPVASTPSFFNWNK